MKNLLQRSSSGIIYALMVAFFTLYSPWAFIIGFSIFYLICFKELADMLRFENKWYLAITLAVGGYLMYSYGIKLYHGLSLYSLNLTNALPVVLFIIALFTLFKKPEEIAFDSSKIIFSTVYLSLPFALAFTLNKSTDFNGAQEPNLLFYSFIMIWCSDSFAYLTGSLFGKTKFTNISKNKTLEGLIGGAVSVIIVGILLQYILPTHRFNWIIISILIAIFAPIGDLAESKLKRIFGVKDSGNLIPGHGGLLDRLDSFIVVCVALYAYLLIV